jgi:hypothetical protein
LRKKKETKRKEKTHGRASRCAAAHRLCSAAAIDFVESFCEPRRISDLRSPIPISKLETTMHQCNHLISTLQIARSFDNLVALEPLRGHRARAPPRTPAPQSPIGNTIAWHAQATVAMSRSRARGDGRVVLRPFAAVQAPSCIASTRLTTIEHQHRIERQFTSRCRG